MSAATTTMTHEVPPKSGLRAFVDKLKGGDEIAHLITLISAAGIILITSLLVLELWRTSQLSRAKFGWMFFWTKVWDANFDNFGAATFIYGTLVTSAVALVIAVPLGLASAASRCSRGTFSSTSRETEMMNGTTMMASTIPAVRNPTP